MANINQKRGPTTGNHGTPSKVATFHDKHARAEMLADSVKNHFASPTANFTGKMERQAPVSLPKTTGKK